MTVIHYLPRECPYCGDIFSIPSVLSTNNMGGRTLWTDGHVTRGEPLNAFPVVACPTCRKILWTEELLNDPKPEDEYIDYDETYPQPLPPTTDEYFEYGSRTDINAQQELLARVLGWHSANDPRREDIDNREMQLKENAKENLRILEAILPVESLYDHMLMAEVKRELSDFSGALEVVDQSFDISDEPLPIYTQGLGLIMIMAEQKDYNVFRINKNPFASWD